MAARAETETARALAARLFNAQPDEIALTGGNSPGWGSAFAAFATAHPWQPGDRILVGRHEWGGNLACMRLIAERAARAWKPFRQTRTAASIPRRCAPCWTNACA